MAAVERNRDARVVGLSDVCGRALDVYAIVMALFRT